MTRNGLRPKPHLEEDRHQQARAEQHEARDQGIAEGLHLVAQLVEVTRYQHRKVMLAPGSLNTCSMTRSAVPFWSGM